MGPRSLSHISGIQLSGVEKIKLAVIYEKNENFYIHSSRLMLNVCMQYIYIYDFNDWLHGDEAQLVKKYINFLRDKLSRKNHKDHDVHFMTIFIYVQIYNHCNPYNINSNTFYTNNNK